MVTRIYKRRPPRLFLAEHREKVGLSAEQLAGRVGVTRQAIWRWEGHERRPTAENLAAIANALDKEVEELFRPPGRSSIDAMLSEAPDELFKSVEQLARSLTRKTG